MVSIASSPRRVTGTSIAGLAAICGTARTRHAWLSHNTTQHWRLGLTVANKARPNKLPGGWGHKVNMVSILLPSY
jgi:hypothetical protein